MTDYDLIAVGGGLAGAALAGTMAARGARVLVLEREGRFRDRVRGEGMHPWGVAEARALGVYELLLDTCGHESRWWRTTLVGMPARPPRDLPATTPHRAGSLNFHHPSMQEAMLRAAAAAGAEVRRGATVVGVTLGAPAAVAVRADGGADEGFSARLVVGADGRASRVRRWGGFTVACDPDRLVIAGLLLTGMRAPDDTVHLTFDPSIGRGAIVFPLGDGRHRAYAIGEATGRARRLSGQSRAPDFMAACIAAGLAAGWFAAAEVAGPLAAFDGAATWVDAPYRDGVALIGDAAGASDPSWGCGLSLALRDARVLRDRLLEGDDWEAAGRVYAAERDGYFGALRRIENWLADLLYDVGPEADATRARVLPKLAQEPALAPDIVGRGPDGPNDEATLRRFR